MSGLPVDNQSRHLKLICSQAQQFSRADIHLSQDIIKNVIDKHLLFTDIPPHYKGQMWVVEYFQRIKVRLQNQIIESRDDICATVRQAMNRLVTRLSELVTAEMVILTMVSLRERAWSLYYGEGETDLVIEYYETQRNIGETVVFPSFELKQGLHSMFSSVLLEIASGRQINFITVFKTARRIFPEGGIMHQYDIIATADRTLRPDLELLKKQHQEVNAAELRRAAAIPNPFLKMALQDDIRARQYELELPIHEHSSMEEHTFKDYCAAKVLQSERVKCLCWGRPIRTGYRPTPSPDPYYDAEVPEGFDFMLLLCDPRSCPDFIRNSNLRFRQFTGYGGLRNIPQYDHLTELSAHPSQEAPGNWDSDQASTDSEYSDLEQEPRSDTDSARQEQSPPEGASLNASYTSTPLEEDLGPNNEINGLLDNLDDMIDRSPAAPLAVPVPRARRNLAVELDKDEMDFSAAPSAPIAGARATPFQEPLEHYQYPTAPVSQESYSWAHQLQACHQTPKAGNLPTTMGDVNSWSQP